ncbi:MAG: flagellar biosynthetic protein FliO [Candidatus Microbacterium colombiense]|nr:MAG: flagellar biosynthetic protein FliO [Microbacterium sp.]
MDDLLVALRMIVALAAVLGLLLFLSRRLQKASSKGGNPLAALLPSPMGRKQGAARLPASGRGARARAEKIVVVARSGIGAKAQLVVAEFGGIRYVLGVTEHGISVVDTQEAPVAQEDSESMETTESVEDPLGLSDEGERALKSVA